MSAQPEIVTTDETAPPPALTALVRARLGRADASTLADGWRKAKDATRPRPRARFMWVGALALGAAGIALWFSIERPTERQLPYRVSGTASSDGALGAGTQVAFADGARFALAEQGAGRIEAVAVDGARVRLQRGRLEADVPRGRYTVLAGPFQVHVRGTAFSMTWHEPPGRLEVLLARGTAAVEGPTLGGPVSLQPGQRFVTELASRETRIGDVESPRAAPVPAAPRPEPRSAPSPSPKPPGWAARLRAGDFAGIVADAERGDLRATLARADEPTLAALADAARYERKNALASRALEALRRRFPRAGSARDAAFHLGRLEEATHGPGPSAVAWYERYLRESPGGTFAEPALARKVDAVARTSGRERARPLAEEYLRRFPGGDFAAAARALLAAP